MMSRVTRVLLLLALAIAAIAPLRAFAQDSLEAAKQQELEDIRRQAAENRKAAAALKPREKRAVGDLRRTERELSSSRGRLRKLQKRQQALGAQLEVTKANLERSIATLEGQRGRLRARLRRMYMTGPARELEYLLSTGSFAQLLARWDFLNMVAEQDRILLEDVRDQKDRVEANQEKLEGNLTEVQVNQKRTAQESGKLASLRQEKAKTVKNIQGEREAYEAAAAELERTAKRIQSLLAALEKRRREEAAKAKTEGRNPQPYSGDFAKGLGQLEWPVRGNIVGHFGIDTHPRFGTQIRNDGIDISAAIGTPVAAVAKGRVDFANDDYEGMGGMIVLNHGDGYFTLYGHLDAVLVSSGQEVGPGATIGRVGDAGSLKGPVLHFEVRKGSSPQNPETWLR